MTRKPKEILHRLEEFEIPDSSFIEGLILMELMQCNDVIPSARKIISADYFSDDTYRRLWTEMLKIWDKGEKITMASMLQPLPISEKTRLLAMISNEQYSYGPAIERQCVTLADLYARRMVYFSALNLLQKASGDEDVDVVGEMETMAKAIRESSHSETTAITLDDAFERYSEQLEHEVELVSKGMAIRCGTGFPKIDAILAGGFNQGDLVILAARPSVGKTALMLQMAEYASRIGYPSVMFSLEMTCENLARRFILAKERVRAGDINRAHIDWERLNQSIDDYRGVSIMIDDTPSALLDSVVSKTAILVQQGKCRAVFIDYLQLMRGSDTRNKNQNQIIGEMTTTLKKVAKQYRIPIVLLSQLSRESARENRPPQLFDLRDSGSIEQDADTVLMLDRHDFDNGKRGVDVWIRKNRNGQAGDFFVTLKANDTFTRFSEYSEDDYSPVRTYNDEQAY